MTTDQSDDGLVCMGTLTANQLAYFLWKNTLDTDGSLDERLQRLREYAASNNLRRSVINPEDYLVNPKEIREMTAVPSDVAASEIADLDDQYIEEEEVNVIHTSNRHMSATYADLSKIGDSKQSSGSEKKRNNNSSLYMKEAASIANVRVRDSEMFENLIQDIEAHADMFDWDERTMNTVVFMKVSRDFLQQIKFNKEGSWLQNRKHLRTAYGLNTKKIQTKVTDFELETGEESLDAFRRFMKIIENPNFKYKQMDEDLKKFTIDRAMKKILPNKLYLLFSTLWIQQDETVEPVEVLRILERTDELCPIPQIPQTQKAECFAMNSGKCYRCNQPGHFANECPYHKMNQGQMGDNKAMTQLEARINKLDVRMSQQESSLEEIKSNNININKNLNSMSGSLSELTATLASFMKKDSNDGKYVIPPRQDADNHNQKSGRGRYHGGKK